MPPVTVLLRTLNAEPFLGDLLPRILSQTLVPLELLVVDSGSRDETVLVCRAAGARVVTIPSDEFTHARSTNLGFREAKGEFVAMLSQDALPTDDRWLSELTAPLADPGTVAAFGRQLPRPGCFPLERWELERCYPDSGTPGTPYSNVNSAARREAWETRGFDESLRIAEDQAWAESWMREGRTIAYVPGASVLHSHEYTLEQVYRRCRDEAGTRRRQSGRREGLGLLVRGWPKQTLHDAGRLRREGSLRLWPRAAAYRFAQLAGMVAGGRA